MTTQRITAKQKGKVTKHGVTAKQKGKATTHSITKQRKGKATTSGATAKRDEGFQALSSEVPVFRFYDPKYKYIKLSKDRQTVENHDLESSHLVVMSEEPMTQNMLYQVEILKTDDDLSGTALGVVTKRPDTIEYTDFWSPGPEILRVSLGGIWVNGEWKVEVRPVLKDLPEGSKVGLAVDSDRSLHLYIDGKHQDVLAPNIAAPCYFMFYVTRDTKVTALPVTPVP